jgi:hypothetical protein
MTSVLQYENLGRVDYDALEMHLERRLRRGLSARVSYALGYSRGNTSGNGSPQILVQQLDDLRLDANEGPTDFDRRHNFVVSTTAVVPRTGGLTLSAIARALSGLPFSIIDSSADQDRNGILFDFGEVFNVTNAASFDNPVTSVQGHPAADRRLAGFLELRALRPGTIPRTGQIGIRFGF